MYFWKNATLDKTKQRTEYHLNGRTEKILHKFHFILFPMKHFSFVFKPNSKMKLSRKIEQRV